MNRIPPLIALAAFVACLCARLGAHDISKTPITWNREISRLVYDKCATCHRPGGTAVSMLTYQEVQPRAVAIRDAVLSRRMPPWGAVKGFGEFRNDSGLNQEQIELLTDWVEEDTPKGNNPRSLPKPPTFDDGRPVETQKPGRLISGTVTLEQPMSLDGLLPERIPDGTSMQIVAALPGGATKPLVWLYEYKDTYRHPFLFRRPLELPAGTTIRGVLPDARVRLIPK